MLELAISSTKPRSNPYRLLLRPPQMQAAHFKRLYRK